MVADLREHAVPFPRGCYVKLWQEMAHVWVSRRRCLSSQAAGRRRWRLSSSASAAGAVDNATDKEYAKSNLAAYVKVLGLAPDRRPT